MSMLLSFLSRQLHTPTNSLILSLAVSDFFVGFLLFFQSMFIDGCWYIGDLMCVLYCCIDYITISSSVGNMILISTDRYVAICDPLHYSIRVTQKRVQVCVCLCWIWSLFYCIVFLKDNLKQPGQYNSCVGECVIIFNKSERVADVILIFILPITVIVVLYMRVFVVAVSQARAMRSHITTVTVQGSRKVTAKKSELKAARTLGVVVGVFIICFCPYYCVSLADQETLFNASSAAFVLCLFYFNSCLNPLIYASFYPWFRKCTKVIVTLQILKSGSSDTNIL
ncbi:trace amine-associated receptor 13c-like [Mastacembelus armatus]|uniref:trace amine-associated receptor 13c-like n=1 Tax=Mastacembelus armatus TaxID=205130 RepID=UPI000E458057|nr:trace amine-associated receptor 13c-like [Mastacembelus armatus]